MKLRNLFFLAALAGLASCSKDNFNYPAGTVGISKIVYFPSIAIKGSKIIAVQQGAAYTDAGATAILNGAAAQYTVSPTISSSTAPGIYTVTYTAANPQGFTATDFRIVVVVSTTVWNDATANANDFSGTYARTSNGVTSTWTKIAPGTYQVENPGGATSGAGLYVIVQNYPGNTIAIPSQYSPYFGGTVSSTNAIYTPGSPAKYSWVYNAPNYGTSTRTFVKQ